MERSSLWISTVNIVIQSHSSPKIQSFHKDIIRDFFLVPFQNEYTFPISLSRNMFSSTLPEVMRLGLMRLHLEKPMSVPSCYCTLFEMWRHKNGNKIQFTESFLCKQYYIKCFMYLISLNLYSKVLKYAQGHSAIKQQNQHLYLLPVISLSLICQHNP